MSDMARVRLEHPATYEDLIGVPDHLVAEIVDGELYASPRPAPRHARSASSLGALLMRPFDHGRGGPGGWLILDEPELHVGRDVLVPDVAGWRRVHLPRLPKAAWFDIAPDWLCEVLSPSTAALDRAGKLRVYARERVAHVWLADPVARTLEVFRLESGHWVLVGTHAGEEIVRAEPFEAVELELGLLWSDAPEDPTP